MIQGNIFIVLREASKIEYNWSSLSAIANTLHIMERDSRVAAYESLMMLGTEFIGGFIVNKGHINGPELHMINNNGVIYIFNLGSKRLITILGARPQQIKRYYEQLELDIPSEVKDAISKSSDLIRKHNINNL